MALFLATHINKVDKKGRVSVPAAWRAELSAESFQGVVLFRSHNHLCLEGFAWSYMQELSARLDNFDLFSAEQDDLATTVFADSVQLSFDGDGRIVMPSHLLDYAQLSDHASFIGMGMKFQVWAPDVLEKRKEAARRQVKDTALTIPKGGQA